MEKLGERVLRFNQESEGVKPSSENQAQECKTSFSYQKTWSGHAYSLTLNAHQSKVRPSFHHGFCVDGVNISKRDLYAFV